MIRAVLVSEWFISIIEWWAHVTVTPEANRIVVFNKGISKGLNDIISVGGQEIPIS